MTVTTKQFSDMLSQVHSLDQDQVNQLVDAIKLRRNRINNMAMHGVQVGNSVSFTGRGGNTVTGKVVKKAIKYVTVDTGMGRWKVPANMLTIQQCMYKHIEFTVTPTPDKDWGSMGDVNISIPVHKYVDLPQVYELWLNKTGNVAKNIVVGEIKTVG